MTIELPPGDNGDELPFMQEYLEYGDMPAVDEAGGASQEDDVYARGDEAVELAVAAHATPDTDDVATEVERPAPRPAPPPFVPPSETITHQPPLLAAEALDVPLQRTWVRSQLSRVDKWPQLYQNVRMRMASSCAELALATPDEAEAEEAFAIAEHLYDKIIEELEPNTEGWLDALRAAEYMPIQRMRRAGEDEAVIATAAYGVLGRYLARVAVTDQTGTMVRSLVAGSSAPALLARAGIAPYISSVREKQFVHSQGYKFLPDFHIFIDGKKISASVRTKASTKPSHEAAFQNNNRVLTLKYIPDVCHRLRNSLLVAPDGSRPPVDEVIDRIGQLLSRESAHDETLTPEERELLDGATGIIAGVVQKWCINHTVPPRDNPAEDEPIGGVVLQAAIAAMPDITPSELPNPPARYADVGYNLQLPLAEELPADYMRAVAQGYLKEIDIKKVKGIPVSAGTLIRAASSCTEWALASAMGDEAETAFAHAKELYAAALPQFKPGTELALRGRRSNEYVSIMRMRRAGEDETVIAAAAYQVLGRSLQQVAPRRSFFETVGSYRKGIAAEDIIASLLARKGTAPYISSEREGRGGSYDREVLRLVSDFHIIRNNKVPIEVKYATETVTAGYDRSKILVVKYLPMVCEPMMREWPTLYPDVQTAAVHVARLLIEESVGNTALSAEEHAVLDLASVIVDNIVNEWLAQREQDRDIQ